MFLEVRNVSFFVVVLLIGSLVGCSHTVSSNKDRIAQYSTYHAIKQGQTKGVVTVGELLKKGDLGIGVNQHLDGAVTILGEKAYLTKQEFEPVKLDRDRQLSFALTTKFDTDSEYNLANERNFSSLKSYLDRKIFSKNILHAIKITGKFQRVKVRSYGSLYRNNDGTDTRSQFRELENVEGKIIGFRFPLYMENITPPGYHIHFYSKRENLAGHVSDFVLEEARVRIGHSRDFTLKFPQYGSR